MPALQKQGKTNKVFIDGNMPIPDSTRILRSLQTVEKTRAYLQRDAFEKFIKNIDAIEDEPLGAEFDVAVNQRFTIAREFDA